MTLLLWKSPVVASPDEAEALLKPYYERNDDSAFQPSAVVVDVAKELIRRFPDVEGGPWGDSAPEESDRLLLINIRWGADNAVVDAIVELAREHELVLYDPQGPDIHVPGDTGEAGPVPAPRLIDHLKIAGFGVGAIGIFALGWWIDVPVLNWLLMIIGGFLFAVVLFLAYILAFGPKGDATR